MTDPVEKTKTKKVKPPMTKKERHARFLGIKRLYREKARTKYALNSYEYRLSRYYITIIDRIGAEDLENFLAFLGVRIPRSTIRMWTDIQKVDNLLNGLDKLRKKIQTSSTPEDP